MKKAAALVRVSTEIQTLESQVEALKSVANSFGYEIPDNFIFQEKVSGYDKYYYQDRKSIVELKHFIKTSKPDAIFIWELSRLSRRAAKIYQYIYELSVLPNIPMYFYDLDSWTIDPETGVVQDANISKINGNAEGCEREREKIKARTKRGRDLTASKGLYVGHLSDGYKAEKDKTIVFDEPRMEVIRKIFRLVLDGSNTVEIANLLNKDGVPTTNAYRMQNPNWNHKAVPETLWTRHSVAQILKNRWYCGERTYSGNVYRIPSIVSEEEWQKVQTIMLNNNPISSEKIESTKHFYLLNGLIKCGRCGKKLYAQYGGLCNHYFCSSKDSHNKCGLRGLNQDNADAIVFKVFNEFFLKRDILNSVNTNANGYLTTFFSYADLKNKYSESIESAQTLIQSKKNDIQKNSSKLDKIVKMLIETDQSSPSYLSLVKLKSETESAITNEKHDISELELRIVDLEERIKKIGDAKTMYEKFNSLSNEDFRALIRPLIDNITIYNADVSITVLVISTSDLLENRTITILYSPRLLRNKFILLYEEFLSSILIVPVFSKRAQIFLKYARSMRNVITYDTEKNQISIAPGIHLLNNKEGVFLASEENIGDVKKEYEATGAVWDFEDFTYNISVREFVNICREPKTPVFSDSFLSPETRRFLFEQTPAYTKTLLLSYTRLSEPSEKALLQNSKYKQWRKKYNTGKKSCEPFITKDELYNSICKERQKLYHRLEKIKKHKTKTLAQKQKEEREIRERLLELRKQIHYFGDSKRATKYKKH